MIFPFLCLPFPRTSDVLPAATENAAPLSTPSSYNATPSTLPTLPHSSPLNILLACNPPQPTPLRIESPTPFSEPRTPHTQARIPSPSACPASLNPLPRHRSSIVATQKPPIGKQPGVGEAGEVLQSRAHEECAIPLTELPAPSSRASNASQSGHFIACAPSCKHTSAWKRLRGKRVLACVLFSSLSFWSISSQ